MKECNWCDGNDRECSCNYTGMSADDIEYTPPTLEEWCKEHGYSVFDQLIEESYKEYLINN